MTDDTQHELGRVLHETTERLRSATEALADAKTAADQAESDWYDAVRESNLSPGDFAALKMRALALPPNTLDFKRVGLCTESPAANAIWRKCVSGDYPSHPCTCGRAGCPMTPTTEAHDDPNDCEVPTMTDYTKPLREEHSARNYRVVCSVLKPAGQEMWRALVTIHDLDPFGGGEPTTNLIARRGCVRAHAVDEARDAALASVASLGALSPADVIETACAKVLGRPLLAEMK